VNRLTSSLSREKTEKLSLLEAYNAGNDGEQERKQNGINAQMSFLEEVRGSSFSLSSLLVYSPFIFFLLFLPSILPPFFPPSLPYFLLERNLH
jgi:hypothetical protein